MTREALIMNAWITFTSRVETCRSIVVAGSRQGKRRAQLGGIGKTHKERARAREKVMALPNFSK